MPREESGTSSASERSRRRSGSVALLALLATAPVGCGIHFGGFAGAPGAVMAGGALAGGVMGSLVDRPRQPGDVIPGAAVNVTLDPRRDVAVVSGVRGDTSWLRGVDQIVGTVVYRLGDTLLVRVTEAHASTTAATFPADGAPTAEIIGGPGVAVRTLARSAKRTTSVFVGAVVGGALAYFYLMSGLGREGT